MQVYDEHDPKPKPRLDVSKLAGPRVGDLDTGEKARFYADLAGQMSGTMNAALMEAMSKACREAVEKPFRPASEALDAYTEGDRKPMRDLASEHLGLAVDGKFGSFLDAAIRHTLEEHEIETEVLPIPNLYRAFRLLGIRLERDAKTKRAEEQNPMVRRGIKRFASLDYALDVIRRHKESREEARDDRIPGLGYIEDYQARPVAKEIRKEAERPDKPGLVSATDPFELPGHDDGQLELVAVVLEEKLRNDADGAGLSAQESEVFALLLEGLDDTLVAGELGLSVKHVGVVRRRIAKKLREVA